LAVRSTGAGVRGPATTVIRRTILGDEDPAALGAQASESFTGARDYADKSEIAQSMVRLKKFYGMDAYPISRQGKTVKPGEPVILVGHVAMASS